MAELEPTLPRNPEEPRVGITQDAYLRLFLDAEDLGPGMRKVQDTRLKGPDDVDVWFPKYQGILTGFAVWMGPKAAPLWRLVDIRTVFPTAWQASAWHAEALGYSSEGRRPVSDAPPVGNECKVFGGEDPLPGLSLTMTHFYYLFRAGRVAVKLYIAQGMESQKPLTPALVVPIASRIVKRIEKVNATR
jgi:hypothetical protein